MIKLPLIRGLLALSLLTGVMVPPAFAQVDRRDRQFPELILDTGGRTGYCDVLRFSPDGKFLFATGDDHVVTVLEQSARGLEAQTARKLRWPSWREQRGAIYAMDVSPDDNGQRVAIGGLGIRNSALAILDRASGKIVAATFLEKGSQNFFGVKAVRFSADGKLVAIGSGDGSIWTWTPGAKPELLGTHNPRGAEFNLVRLVGFDEQGRVLSLAQDGQLLRWNGPTAAAVVLDLKLGTATVRAAELSADGKWLAATGTLPKVFVRSLDKAHGNDLDLPEGQFGRSVAFSKGNRLAVGVGALSHGNLEADEKILLADVAAAEPKAGLELPHRGRAESLAWHGENRLAVAGGDNHDLTLWDLDHRERALSVFRGMGAGIWAAAISENGKYVAFKDQRNPKATDPNDRGANDWQVFNLTSTEKEKPKFESAVPADFKPVLPLRTASNWSVAPSKDNPYVWYAVDPDGKRQELPLDRDRDGMPRCFAFLPGKPLRLVVGHYWGASVFELGPSAPRRTHLLTGHQGEVMALAPSKEGDWLVTAANDQTLAAWSLRSWPSKSTWGLKLKPDSLTVAAVDIGSPAWEMGLVEGDEILLTAIGSDLIYKVAAPLLLVQGDTKQSVPQGAKGTATEARRRLETAVPGKEVFLGVKRAGLNNSLPLKSTLRTRPLWRFFPSRDREWVLWMWQNSFYDTSTSGDFLIGWQVNEPSLEQEPRFFRAEQFRKQFHREDVIRELLETRDLASTLKYAQGDNPLPLNFQGFEPPAVSMQLSDKIAKDKVTIELTAAPRGDNPDHLPQRAELWINDHRLEMWPLQGKKFTQSVTVEPRLLRSGDNKLTFQVFNRLEGRSEVVETLVNPAPPAKPKLLGLSVGINDYSASPEKTPDGSRNLLTNLESAVNDARRQQERWLKQQGKLYEKADVRLKVDKDARPAEVLKALDDLARKAGPNDVILLTFSGHGDFLKAAKEKGTDSDLFVFCGPDYARAKYSERGIDSQTLYNKIVAIPGRKVLILDACHSGEAVFSPVRALTPAGLGPTILAACDRSEFSYEHKKIGNGVFTYALLQAMDRAPADANGLIDVKTLFDYAKAQVPGILKELGRPENAQHPVCFPRQPERFPIMKR